MRFALAAILALSASFCRAEDNIVIVFDTSGSMAEWMRSSDADRMTVAQRALTTVTGDIPEGTNLGIVTFSGWIYDLQPVDKKKLAAAIASTTPSGGTPLYEFMKAGADRLLQERERKGNVGTYRLIVVTDGEANDEHLNQREEMSDGFVKAGILADIVGRGIVVDAIGLDMAGGHSLSTLINGRYMAGDDASSLEAGLRMAVAEVSYKPDDVAGADAFSEINEFPEEFVKASLTALTEFRNHPIGERPPVKVVQPDGTVVEQPDPAQVAENEAEESGFGGWLCVTCFVVFAIAVIVLYIGSVLNR